MAVSAQPRPVTAPASAVVRLRSPGDVVAAVPYLCGFPPSESLVGLSLRGARKRLGLTMRLDLPAPGAEREVAELFGERLAADGAAAVALVVWSESPPATSLVRAVTAACDRRGVEVTEALHVRAGRWTSYLCTGPCCPATGTPVRPGPAAGLLEAGQVLSGQALLGSRSELAASLAPPVDLAAARRRQEAAQRALELQGARSGRREVRERAVAAALDALRRVADGRALEADDAVRLGVSLADVLVRDEVLTWALDDSDSTLALLQQVVRQVLAPHDVPACTALAWVAYERGNGALANVALDRALAGDPGYSLALLVRQCLDAGLPPRHLRATMRGTRRLLPLRSPGERPDPAPRLR